MRHVKTPLLRKSEIADDPKHAHSAKAASQLTDEAAVYLVAAFHFTVKFASEGRTDAPELRYDDLEVLTTQPLKKN